MVTQLNDSYQDYIKSKTIFENKKSNLFLGSFLFFAIIAYSLFAYIRPDFTWSETLSMSFVFSLFLAMACLVFCVDFSIIARVPSLENFVFSQMKTKYQECIWLDYCIHFKDGDKFYKVEKIQPADGVLKIISKETKPFRIDTIS